MGITNTVHVSGFPRETRARNLAPDFESIGKVVRIDIPPMRPFQDRPYAFVQYETLEECERAVERLNGKAFTLDSRFAYHVQLARSQPYPSSHNALAGRGGRGSQRGNMVAGFNERGYRGRDYRDIDPRDYRSSMGPHRSGDRYRGNWREYRGRGPREYRDREPPRAYERIPPVDSQHDTARAYTAREASVDGQEDLNSTSSREELADSAPLEGILNENKAQSHSLGDDGSRAYSIAGNDGKTAGSDVDKKGSKEIDNREPNGNGRTAENIEELKGRLSADESSSKKNHILHNDVEYEDENTQCSTSNGVLREEGVSSK